MAWLQLPQAPVKRAVCGALIISAATSGFHVFASWFSVSPHGTDLLLKHISGMVVGILLITVLYNVLRLVVSALGLLFGIGKSGWPQLGAAAAFCGIVFVFMMLAVGAEEAIRDAAFRSIAARGGPLVTAIKQFQAKNGAPPGGLDELVPDFIPAIPDTGIAAYPKYEYLRKPDPAKFEGNPWVLFVNVSTDDLMQDLLIFDPKGNYPARPQVASARRFGDWSKISTPNPANHN